MLVYIQAIIALVIGVISTVTDFKDNKIYNKHICTAIIFSVIAYILFWHQIEIDCLKNFIINFAITMLVSFSFFYLKIWAAGDAKLLLTITFMIPYEIYEVDLNNIFPTLYLLIIIFSVAFIYVFFETIYLLIRDRKKFDKLRIKKRTKSEIVSLFIQYLMGYFIILFINRILFEFFSDFREYNAGLLVIVNMLVLFFVYRVIKNKKK